MTTFGWLDQRGVDHSTLKYVEIPAAATLAAMTQNQVVASTVSEPFFSADMNSGKVRILGYPYSALGRHFATAVLFADTAWVETHRDVVTRFLKATQEASAYVAAHENSDELRMLMAQYAGVDPDAIKNQRSPGRGVILAPGDLQPVIDYAAKYKVIPKAFPAQDVICSCALRK
jgi:NitT/TauT family transport system substrate-binding protein